MEVVTDLHLSDMDYQKIKNVAQGHGSIGCLFDFKM